MAHAAPGGEATELCGGRRADTDLPGGATGTQRCRRPSCHTPAAVRGGEDPDYGPPEVVGVRFVRDEDTAGTVTAVGAAVAAKDGVVSRRAGARMPAAMPGAPRCSRKGHAPFRSRRR